MPSPKSPIEIADFIAKRDRAFKGIVALAGPPPRPRPARVDDRFAALVRSITFQLLATNAANTIHGRVVEACGGEVSVESILKAGSEKLKGAGLNRTKAQAMVNLARDVLDERVQLSRHGRMSDDEIVKDVASVRGIGPWTAHMYLMFTLARPDVWPVGDYGVRNGWSMLHGLDEMVTEVQLRGLGDVFEGARSSVAWYCWEAVHLSRQAK